MKWFRNLFVLGVLAVFLASCGAAIKFQSGDDSLQFLKNEKQVKAVVDFSKASIGSSATEKEYIDSKVSDKNAKSAGSGDEWKKAWDADKRRFTTMFESALNKTLEKRGVSTMFEGNADSAKLTLEVTVTHLEPGFNVGIMSKPSNVTATLKIYKTSNPSDILAVYDVPNSVGSAEFTLTQRLEAAFNNLGYGFGKYIAKKMK